MPPATERPTDGRAQGDGLGLRLIITYKAVKAVVEVALAILVLTLARHGELSDLRSFAVGLEHHVGSRWSVLVGRAVLELMSGRGLHLVELGLAVDGVFSAFEGWSLWRRYRWAPWLVVIATATPLPLEVAHVLHTRRLSRLVFVLLNAAVVAYLACRIVRQRAEEKKRP